MTGPRFLVSAATILSDPARADEFFGSLGPDRGAEFGYSRSPQAAEDFAVLAAARFWGLHFPRLAVTPAYLESGADLETLLEDTAWARARGASYIIAHLPYFENAELADLTAVEELARRVASASSLPVLAELKLGQRPHGDPGVFALESAGLLEALGPLRLCLDLGDAFLAGLALDVDPYRLIRNLAPGVELVHVHTVRWPRESHYIWEPVHPDLEQPGYLSAVRALDELADGGARPTFVYEHTPHRAGSIERVREGQAWFESAVAERFSP